ncbi:DEAD/DEAH box helicase [Parahaliea mediterranea]|uniref:ATP-dependent RNA helicase DeaD n=1 Tax=Parahaliea mediterranea TaxID=651086 RepID=A0A939DCX1_9GAMM|nr:DEAD/DEAH box helicase [Parahaliea mediterranea]MBN7795267.1 DEAD/DEAH box helicase [Parahaliea mediterranea]
MSQELHANSFAELALPDSLQKALRDVGYETPSAIQARTIPTLLNGVDMVGQAQTGTGKTAAFALPALARLELDRAVPQVLVLAPTRELAIQVAEAFQKYAHYLPGFRVLPLYGGADYRGQLRQLQRGVHVIVGTPGRVMDHMRRGSLSLDSLRLLVLDEADEMLRMGFIDDVEWVLTQTPPTRQIALFSATMPDAIRRIARQHLTEPAEVTIAAQTVTNEAIRQRVWMMAGVHKLDALTRILEVEDFDAAIIFVRTRLATSELADKLAARGYTAAALNGDVPQKLREKIVDQLKKGQLDILVATDVAARGLDVERISHVINYDIPYDVEAYVHRIGRTGRAGRAGEAILFAANRERRLLRAIEKATGQSIEKMELPSAEQVADKRQERLLARVTETLASSDLDAMRQMIERYQHEHGVPVLDIAAALGRLLQGAKGSAKDKGGEQGAKGQGAPKSKPARRDDRAREEAFSEDRRPEAPRRDKAGAPRRESAPPGKGMERFRIEVGHSHGVKPGNIVGAIANEAEIDSQYIGHINIHDDHSTVDLPEGMPAEVYQHLKGVWVSGRRLQIQRLDSEVEKHAQRKPRKPKGGPGRAAKRPKR